MLWANRNGFFYVLDRTTGEFLQASRSSSRTGTPGFDNGRPIRAPNAMPNARRHADLSGQPGRHQLVQPVVQPAHGPLLRERVGKHAPHLRACRSGVQGRASYTAGRLRRTIRAAAFRQACAPRSGPTCGKKKKISATVRAFDPQTGKWRWEYKMSDLTDAGILTTASDFLFSGGREGYFFALDARTGSLLWKVQLGGPAQNGPMTYSVNGRQTSRSARATRCSCLAFRNVECHLHLGSCCRRFARTQRDL